MHDVERLCLRHGDEQVGVGDDDAVADAAGAAVLKRARMISNLVLEGPSNQGRDGSLIRLNSVTRFSEPLFYFR